MRVYEEIDYANQRLKNTVVRYDKKPIIVTDVYPGPMNTPIVDFIWLSNGNAGTCKLKELDIDPVPLGYCNYQGVAYYLCRMPMREDWRQGLRETSLRTWDGSKFGIYKAELHRTITGDYPILTKARKILVDQPIGTSSVAFSRDFATTIGEDLYYRGKHKIGKIGAKDYDLKKEFTWVEDLLEREIKR